jgi:DNA-binding beta-propeller fold protein YncE
MKPFAILFCAGILSAQPFKLEKTIPLPGVEGRFDHMAIDLAAKHLMVAALGNNTVEVLDLAAGRKLQTWSGMKEPQGIAFAADVKRIYVASGKDGKLRIYDSATLKPTGQLDVGEDADNVRYEGVHQRVWVAHGDGAITAIDAGGKKKIGSISLDAHPESFQFETSGARIFVNVPGAGEIEVVDREKKTIVAKWPVKEAGANFPMALDEADHRLFAGCRKPAKVLVYNIDTGKVTAQITCPGDTDDLFYDSARKRLYVAGGEGFLEAFDQTGPDDYRSIGKVATAPGARTGLYVPELNQFFLAVPHRGAQAAEIRMYSVQ